MTAAGWLFLGLSWSVIISLNAFCFIRLFSHPAASEEPDSER